MFVLNMLVVLTVTAALVFLAGGLLWRVGGWRTPALDTLMEDAGLPIGASCPEIAALFGVEGDTPAHLSFVGRTTLLLFGLPGCSPCRSAVEFLPRHPATRHWSLVYVAGGEVDRLDVADDFPEEAARWSFYRFDDERTAFQTFNVTAAPYFHLISADGRVLTKGVASRSEHIDRLLEIAPRSTESTDKEFSDA